MIEKYFTPYAAFSTYHFINDVLPPELRREEFGADTVDGAISHQSESWKYIESLNLDYKIALAYVEKKHREDDEHWQTMFIELTAKFNNAVYTLAEIRNVLKKNKNFEAADTIREKLQQMGIFIRDLKDGGFELSTSKS